MAVTDYSFIYLCGGDLRPLNHKVIPARRVFRHAGMDVNDVETKVSQIKRVDVIVDHSILKGPPYDKVESSQRVQFLTQVNLKV